MNSPYFLAYPVAEKDMPEALKKTKLPPYPILVRGPLIPISDATISLCRNFVWSEYRLYDIEFVVSANKRVFLYLKGQTDALEFWITLKEMKKILGSLFVPISQSCLVNSSCIASWENRKIRTLVLNNKENKILKISKRFYTSFCNEMKIIRG